MAAFCSPVRDRRDLWRKLGTPRQPLRERVRAYTIDAQERKGQSSLLTQSGVRIQNDRPILFSR
jgi:hypothetical protein